MSVLEDAVRKVLLTNKPTLIKCTDTKNQESIRIMLYHLKKKMLDKSMSETIGITKLTGPDKLLYVKVFKRPKIELFTLDKDGNIIPMEMDIMEDAEVQRIVGLMKSDGRTEEEIEEFIESKRKELEREEKGIKEPDFATLHEEEKEERKAMVAEDRNTEKEEMKKILEQEMKEE
jgi:hypothetical protein